MRAFQATRMTCRRKVVDPLHLARKKRREMGVGKKSPKTAVKKRAAPKPGGRGHNSTYIGQTHIFGPKLSHAKYTKSQKDKKVHVAKSPGATTPKSREVKAAIIADFPLGSILSTISHSAARSASVDVCLI